MDYDYINEETAQKQRVQILLHETVHNKTYIQCKCQ